MINYDSSTIYDDPFKMYDGFNINIVDLDDSISHNDQFCCIGVELGVMTDTYTTSEVFNIDLDMIMNDVYSLSENLNIKADYSLQINDTSILEEDYRLKLYYNGIEILFEDRVVENRTWINREKTTDSWTQRNKVDTTYKTRNKPWLP